MRYKIDEVGVDGAAYAGSADVVTFTVWLTLIIGIGFFVVGIRARQRWLAVWGALTVVACAIYAVALTRGLLG